MPSFWETAPERSVNGAPVCVIPDCSFAIFCKRLCNRHYQAVVQGRLDPATGKTFASQKPPKEVKGYPKSFKGYDKYVWLISSGELLDTTNGGRIPLKIAMNSWGSRVREDVQAEKFKHYFGECWDPMPGWKNDDLYNSYKPNYMLLPEDVGEPMDGHLEQLLLNLGGEDYPWLLDWLAYKIENPWKCTGALVIHGVQGAGKGTLECLMKALFGEQCASIDSLALGTDFNNWADRKFMIIADEINVSSMRDKEVVRKQLKKYTAPNTLLINKKYSNAFNITNHASWIICGNDDRVIDIEEGDRRYSVLRVKTPISADLGEEISNNAEKYAKNLVNSLFGRKITHYREGRPLDNAARRVMMNMYRNLKVVNGVSERAADYGD